MGMMLVGCGVMNDVGVLWVRCGGVLDEMYDVWGFGVLGMLLGVV